MMGCDRILGAGAGKNIRNPVPVPIENGRPDRRFMTMTPIHTLKRTDLLNDFGQCGEDRVGDQKIWYQER